MANTPQQKKVIVIAGPTAAGKTSLAIKIAALYKTEIISADSRQCYKELSIGVARPTEPELAQVPHHFIATHSIHEKVNAGLFEQYALEKAAQIFLHNDVAVMVGGTGLYIDAFCNGIDKMPEISTEIREQIVADYNKYGLHWLQQAIKKNDPLFFSEGEIKNPQRLLRALEIYTATGKSINQFKTNARQARPFQIIKFVLAINKPLLLSNIQQRVDKMMTKGLLHEATSLYPHRYLPALNTVGYKELFACIGGEINMATATGLIKTHTRQYAKRQITWFKKDATYNWHTSQVEILDSLKNIVN